MKTSRREFIRLGGAAALAGLINPTVEAGTTRLLSAPLSISATEQSLLDFLATYAEEVRFVGVGVLEKLRHGTAKHVHVLVSVEDPAVLADVLPNFPFPGVYAHGNTLFFEAGGVEFTVENLPEQAFNERRVLLRKARSIAFGHDALSYEPGSAEVFDPFSASKSDKLKSVNRTFGGIEGLNVIFRGLIEAEQLQLDLGAEFLRWKKRMLRFVAKAKDVAALGKVVLRNLATAAQVLSEAAFKEILQTPFVAAVIAETFEIEASAAIVAYDALRAEHDGSISNAALWVAVFLKVDLESEALTGVLTPLLRGGDYFQNQRSSRALNQARVLINH